MARLSHSRPVCSPHCTDVLDYDSKFNLTLHDLSVLL